MTAKNYGRDDLMAIAAFRYCLGRTSYIVSDCADWLIEQWPNINDKTKNIIRREVEEAFKRDDEDRLGGEECKTLGHECDRAEWERVKLFTTQWRLRDSKPSRINHDARLPLGT